MSNPAFESGFAAFRNDEATDRCEFPLGSDQGREWLRGWTESQIAERDKEQVEGDRDA